MLTLLFTMLWMHPVHESVTEVQWNDQSKRVEVAIRIDKLDEQWIAEKYGAAENVAGGAATGGAADSAHAKWAIEYLAARCRVSPRPGPSQPAAKPVDASTAKPVQTSDDTYHWVGRQDDGAHVWWYFEIQPVQSKRPEWIDQRILFDRELNYTHRILVLDHTPPLAANATSRRSRVWLDKRKDGQMTAPSIGNDVQASAKPTRQDSTQEPDDDAPLPPQLDR